ncbi:helix-turn-helix domain-containing protein [Paenibacillus sp. ACRRY]|uniref:helix-turn-helix domain-containing protein n=1 Tax=Paenibacillus sp. ACRRY TaxID=2918208 RepID=UPI001EF5E524|nr:helix-turn-helix domain-containing protein [Paenibacillus sp. ACRRY]MCG7381742.1 helix-turn-helix domain-containing protein [Paenibacillus sp. ACRRY]
MRLQWSKFSPVFRNFLISYLILLMIPQIAGYVSYRVSLQVAREGSIESSIKSLNLGQAIIERNLAQVEDFTKQLAINPDLYRLIADPKPSDTNNVYGLGRMQRSLAMYSSTNDYLSHFFIHIPNYNVIVTPTTVYYRPEHYYAANSLENMTFKEWTEEVLKKPHLNEILPLRNYKRETRNMILDDAPSITFLQSLPLNSFNKPQATIGVVIDEKLMSSLMENITQQYGGWTLVTDREGQIVFSQGIDKAQANLMNKTSSPKNNDVRATDDGQLLISTRSEFNGWTYVTGIPEHSVMAKANQIKQVTLSITLVTLVSGLIIGLFLAYRNSAPIHKLLSTFREQGIGSYEKRDNAFDFLSSNIASLIKNNHKLETALHEQLPLLRDGFITRLLTGEFYTMSELEALSSQTGVSLHNGHGIVGILKLDGYSSPHSEEIVHELSVARLIIKQTIIKGNPNMLVTDWGTDQVAFVYPLTGLALEESEQKLEQELVGMVEVLYQEYRVSTAIGLSSPYHDWNDISRSFNEARQALEYGIHVGAQTMVRFGDAMKETALYYYPMESEQRLINTLKLGETEESYRVLDQLFSRNFQERELSYDMLQQFVLELKGTFLKVAEVIIFRDESSVDTFRHQVRSIQTTERVVQLQDKFNQLVKEICTIVQQKKMDSNTEIVNEIIEFIHERHIDAGLTLYRIAERIGKPEKFISQVFKELTGENIPEYVELVRITKSEKLLRESHLTIDEIAVQSGYNSAHSFRRAFKRVRGVLPSAYRRFVGNKEQN